MWNVLCMQVSLEVPFPAFIMHGRNLFCHHCIKFFCFILFNYHIAVPISYLKSNHFLLPPSFPVPFHICLVHLSPPYPGHAAPPSYRNPSQRPESFLFRTAVRDEAKKGRLSSSEISQFCYILLASGVPGACSILLLQVFSNKLLLEFHLQTGDITYIVNKQGFIWSCPVFFCHICGSVRICSSWSVLTPSLHKPSTT